MCPKTALAPLATPFQELVYQGLCEHLKRLPQGAYTELVHISSKIGMLIVKEGITVHFIIVESCSDSAFERNTVSGKMFY